MKNTASVIDAPKGDASAKAKATLKEQQLQKIKTQPGFIAALDQSGGSTPKALLSYGIKEDAWSNEQQMFDLVHQMRARIITSPSFTGERILAAILFEGTMDRDIKGQPTADFLWNVKRIVPFLKVDKGLADEKDGVHVMKPMPQLHRRAHSCRDSFRRYDGPGHQRAADCGLSLECKTHCAVREGGQRPRR